MSLKLKSARLILFLIGTICLAVAIYVGQAEVVKELLSQFLKEELAGYVS
ncbi:MAG: hypothetical protein NDP13_03470 [Crenarchaeota archaeon]|nr:hypothetical protein [Thermoproteota archaeon]MCR8454029.1 hypothetical protein [Thermoproteota archaeon]MCR8454984.1 hypothetical protein [Thermoproteota archaeon]MCR8463389.1 hypothetical protein [Thermoproteota archaeon]MCR8470432.1 hypothetical protein [Thermoproteota archaeon]